MAHQAVTAAINRANNSPFQQAGLYLNVSQSKTTRQMNYCIKLSQNEYTPASGVAS